MGSPVPVQSSPVQSAGTDLTGLGWPDVKKIRSEAQSYIRRFLGAAVEPCCLLLLPEFRAPSRSTGTQAGWGKESGGKAKGGPAQWPRGGVYARESAWQRPAFWRLASDCCVLAAGYWMLDASKRFQIFRKLSGVFSMTCRGA